jgi:hypothetical protein
LVWKVWINVVSKVTFRWVSWSIGNRQSCEQCLLLLLPLESKAADVERKGYNSKMSVWCWSVWRQARGTSICILQVQGLCALWIEPTQIISSFWSNQVRSTHSQCSQQSDRSMARTNHCKTNNGCLPMNAVVIILLAI